MARGGGLWVLVGYLKPVSLQFALHSSLHTEIDWARRAARLLIIGTEGGTGSKFTPCATSNHSVVVGRNISQHCGCVSVSSQAKLQYLYMENCVDSFIETKLSEGSFLCFILGNQQTESVSKTNQEFLTETPVCELLLRGRQRPAVKPTVAPLTASMEHLPATIFDKLYSIKDFNLVAKANALMSRALSNRWRLPIFKENMCRLYS